MRCHACSEIILPGELLSCRVCRITYDYKCLKISKEYFLRHTDKARYAWECSPCANALHRRISNAQMRNQSSVQDENRNPPLYVTEATASDVIHYLPNTRNISYEEFRSLFYSKLNKIISDSNTTELENPLENNIIKCNNLLDLISAGLSFLRNEIRKKSTTEESELESNIRNITWRLNKLERFTRCTNLEIQMIPENENENLLGILKTICRVINVPLHENAVLNISRISTMNPQAEKPRDIIATLPSQLHRDYIISEFNTYNINNKTRPLNTSHIGIPGDKREIFLSEDLTPYCKAVYIATCDIAKELGFQHVFVRNDDVFIRKDDKSPTILIGNLENVQKLRYYDLFF